MDWGRKKVRELRIPPDSTRRIFVVLGRTEGRGYEEFRNLAICSRKQEIFTVLCRKEEDTKSFAISEFLLAN